MKEASKCLKGLTREHFPLVLNDALGESLVHGWSLAGKDPPWRPMFSPLFPNSIDTQDVLITVYQDKYKLSLLQSYCSLS